MKTRRPTAAEIALWKAATRDVRRVHASAIEPDADPEQIRSASPVAAIATVVVPALPKPAVAAGFDQDIERNILKGKRRIEARLDLHGMTEAVAYAELNQFILRNAAARRRVLLVVTGKGSMGTGVLKRNLPRWADSPPLNNWVAAVRPAYARHGGDGAFYVLLRKRTSL